MTPASNIVMTIIMMMVLLFMAPLFSFTPLVSLDAIITTAMLPLVKYKEIYRFYIIDKANFLICMAAFVGVAFVSMDVGLLISVGLSVVRALVYVAMPRVSKIERLGNSGHYHVVDQMLTLFLECWFCIWALLFSLPALVISEKGSQDGWKRSRS